MEATASMRRAGVERWWITAIEMAKSRECDGCGRERLSATIAEWGWWVLAILMRLVELGGVSDGTCWRVWGYGHEDKPKSQSQDRINIASNQKFRCEESAYKAPHASGLRYLRIAA